MYIYRLTWAKGNRESERKSVTRKEIKSAKVRARKSRSVKIRARKTRSAKARERERKSAKFKAQKRARKDSAGSAKAQARRSKKSACPALRNTHNFSSSHWLGRRGVRAGGNQLIMSNAVHTETEFLNI